MYCNVRQNNSCLLFLRRVTPPSVKKGKTKMGRLKRGQVKIGRVKVGQVQMSRLKIGQVKKCFENGLDENGSGENG